MSLLDKICQAFIKMIRKKDTTKLVWQNASPTSAFVKQEITINAKADDLVTIVHECGSTSANPGKGGHLFYDEYTTGWVIEHRTVTFGNDTENIYVWTRFAKVFANKIRFENCWLRIASNTTYSSEQNMYLIPLKIYGVKSSGWGKLVSFFRNIITKGGVRYA